VLDAVERFFGERLADGGAQPDACIEAAAPVIDFQPSSL
jgi:hypothetical protein